MLKGMLRRVSFQLQLQRVEVRAIQHRHLAELHSFLPQLEHALRDERRLLGGIVAGHQHRPGARLARGASCLANWRALAAMAALATLRISGVLR